MRSKIPKEALSDITERLNKGETYQSIADSYDVSKERIRQIKKEMHLLISGAAIRRKEWLDALLQNINEESKDLFFRSGCNRYDLAEECLNILTMKQKWFKHIQLPFDVPFIGIIWNRKCPHSGIELDYFAERHDQEAPVIDVINRNYGEYVIGNVHTVAKCKKSRKSMV